STSATLPSTGAETSTWAGTARPTPPPTASTRPSTSGGRPPAPGTGGRWGPIQALHPLDPSRGEYFSYGPSLSVDDESDAVLAVLFFDTVPRAGLRLDSAARVLR